MTTSVFPCLVVLLLCFTFGASPACVVSDIEHATKSTTLTEINAGETVTYTCNLGYEFGDYIFGSCSQTIYNVNCPVERCGASSGESILTCPNNGDSNIYFIIRACNDDATWDGDIIPCTAVKCDVHDVANGLTEPTPDENNAISYPEEIFFFCDDGYDFSGVSNQSCNADGQLSDLAPTCTIVTCALEPIDNAIMLPDQDEIDFNQTVAYTCNGNEGYVLISGTAERQCQADGTLSGEHPVCTIVQCRTEAPHATADPDQVYIDFNTSVVYTCDTGYASDDPNRMCQIDGTLSGEDPICSLVTCDTPDIPNAEKDPNVATINYGDSITYTCDSGYALLSPSNGADSFDEEDLLTTVTMGCLSTGALSGPTPECIEIDHCEPNPCENNGICHNFPTGCWCECDSKWTGNHCQRGNAWGVRRRKLKLKFPFTFSGDLEDPDVYSSLEEAFLRQMWSKMVLKLKKRGPLRGMLILKIWKGSLNFEIAIDADNTTDAVGDITMAISGLSSDTFVFFDVQSTPTSIGLDGISVSTSPSAEDTCRLFTALIGQCPGDEVCVIENSVPTCTKSETDEENKTFIYVVVGVCLALVLILVIFLIFTVVLKWKSTKPGIVPLDGPARTVYLTEKVSKLNDY